MKLLFCTKAQWLQIIFIVAFEFFNFAFSSIFVQLKLTYLVTLRFSKTRQNWPFWWTFVYSKCKYSTLRSQWWMRLLLIFKHRAKKAFLGAFFEYSNTFVELDSGYILKILYYIANTLSTYSNTVSGRIVQFYYKPFCKEVKYSRNTGSLLTSLLRTHYSENTSM